MSFFDDEFRDRRYEWAPVGTHEVAQVSHQLEEQQRETAHFKAVSQDLERELKALTETNDRNLETLQKLVAEAQGLVSEFQRQGNFTVCQLVDPLSERVFIGVSCCGAGDTFNEDIGKAISFGRAANARADFYAEAAYAK